VFVIALPDSTRVGSLLPPGYSIKRCAMAQPDRRP